MKLLGSILLLFAASTMALDSLGHDSRMLVLMDRWGVEAGEIIRIAIGLCGLVLLRLPTRRASVEIQREPRQLRAQSEDKSDPMAELHNKRPV